MIEAYAPAKLGQLFTLFSVAIPVSHWVSTFDGSANCVTADALADGKVTYVAPSRLL